MKKNLSLILAGALAFGFAACNNNHRGVDPEQQEGTTHGAVVAKIVKDGSGLKALTDNQQNVAGVGGEDKVANGYLFFKDVAGQPLTMTQDATNTSLYKSQVFATKPNPTANVALLLNQQGNIALTLSDFTKDKKIELKDLKSYIKDTGFLMTSTVEKTGNTINILDNRTENQVNGTEASDNNFSFDVERVVAKLQVSKKSTLTTDPAVAAMGDVDQNLTFALAGSAKEAYLFGDRAGERTLDATTADKHIYKGFISAIDTEATPVLQKVSDAKAGGAVGSFLDSYYSTAKTVNDAATAVASNDNGFFFLENSQFGGTNVAQARGNILFKRIAYAKVYTKFTPKTGKKIKLEGGATLSKLEYKAEDLTDATTADFNAVREYEVVVPQAWYEARKDLAEYRGKFTEHAEVLPTPGDPATGTPATPGRAAFVTFKVKDEAGDFYLGQDNVIYDTQLAAAAAGNTTYKKYKGGKMVYMTPANAQKAGDVINYCDTRRNNIYDLTISGFNALGYNYDPVDPKDPNIPEPNDNPGEPEPNPDEPVQEATTRMRVEAKILQWNLVNRDVTLGKN